MGFVFDDGFDPVGGWEGDRPELRGGAFEGEGNFEAVGWKSFDADDAARFDLIGCGIGEGDILAGHDGHGKLQSAAVGVDDHGFAVEGGVAVELAELDDDADFEEDAPTAAAIADSGVGGAR